MARQSLDRSEVGPGDGLILELVRHDAAGQLAVVVVLEELVVFGMVDHRADLVLDVFFGRGALDFAEPCQRFEVAGQQERVLRLECL